MTERTQNPENEKAQESQGSQESRQENSVQIAALRATKFTLPVAAISFTILLYVVGVEVYRGPHARLVGDLAVLVGMIGAISVWWVFALVFRRYTSAASANRRNYNGLRERLSQLQTRLKYARPEGRVSQHNSGNDTYSAMQNRAFADALEQCKEIERKLDSKGMPWVTGLGYIELWHRTHRADEALIIVEPFLEALVGAIRDQSRLVNSNIAGKDLLLSRLNWTIAVLGGSDTGEEQQGVLSKEEQARPENRVKALLMLSEVRYEINYFRDNVWEGIVHARNRLADTAVLLGLATYALLALAIFLESPPDTIIWATTYFLIGAIAGLFARAQAEWGAETAVDDFGLSKTRLLQIPWLSGLAAVGGVVLLAVVDNIGNSAGSLTIANIFQNKPSFSLAAAIFGLTPDLIVRRLTQTVEQYKDDLQSVQSNRSVQDDAAPHIT